MSMNHLTDKRFTDFSFSEALQQGIADAGFEYCTPIQADTLPLAMEGNDIAGQAQTGTGKSAAFLLAALHYLDTHPPQPQRKPTQPRVLILAPTRELAIQIHHDAEILAKHTDYKLALVYGGTGYESQRQQLQEGTDFLIGTPGRIIDYFKQHIFDLKAIQVMILDEADRMFDLGFIKDIRYVLRRMPEPDQRLNMLFSATLSYRVTELAYDHMNSPEMVQIEPDKVTADLVSQRVYYTANQEKIPLLLGLLNHMDPKRSIVFVNTKRAAELVWGYLKSNGYDAAVLSGDVPQNKRISLLKQFQSGELPILVATDVAARGLHIPEVSHVFNYDLPQEAEDYVHRIGRTARAGAKGDAISFACEDFSYSLPEIEEYIGHKIESAAVAIEIMVDKPKPPVRVARKPRTGPGRNKGNSQPRQNSGNRSRHRK